MALPGQIDLNDLMIFIAVAEAGGFTAAAHRLGVAPAKISVEVGRLESRLGLTLFSRTTRKVALTEGGQALYEECAPLLHQLRSALENVHAASDELSGTLRVTATVDQAMHSVAPAMTRFARRHPGLHVTLRTSDRIADLVAEGFDVAIRMGWLRDSSLRAIRLGEFAQYVVASPDYLRQIRHPRKPEDLAGLDWVALTLLTAPLTWKFTSAKGEQRTVQMTSRIKVDSPSSLRSMIRHGAGVTALDQHSAQADLESGRLVRLLPDWTLPSGGIYAVFPPGRHVSRKAHAFIAFYQQYLRGTVS